MTDASNYPVSISHVTGLRRTISIISPCFNEAEVIERFYEELRAVLDDLSLYDFEVILVDDGSIDRTLDTLNGIADRDPRVRVASFSRNFGHQIALTAGMDFACGDAVIMLDSDLQHPVSLIPLLIERWAQGHDIVSAIRMETEGASVFKRLSSRAFYALINAVSPVKIPNGAADFCLISRRVVDTLSKMRERHRFLRGLISWSGFRRDLVPYRAAARAAGQSKYTLVKMLRMAMDAILLFSTAPIQWAARLGSGVTLVGLLYLGWNLLKAFYLGRMAPGWASLIALTMILGGSQLMFIGLIGQYIARIFEELKDRPLYVLKQDPLPARQRVREAAPTRVAAGSRSI